MFKAISILCASLLIGGCAAPLIVAASLGGSEYAGTKMSPKFQVTGADLQKHANWSQSNERTTYSMNGKDDWLCTRVIAGEYKGFFVCMLPEEVNNANFSTMTYFDCTQGTGGKLAAFVNERSFESYFCRKSEV